MMSNFGGRHPRRLAVDVGFRWCLYALECPTNVHGRTDGAAAPILSACRFRQVVKWNRGGVCPSGYFNARTKPAADVRCIVLVANIAEPPL
jgi:hypothetical protein